MVPELFPHSLQRYRGDLAIGSLIGSGVLGLVAVKILQVTHGHWYGLALYVAVLGVISLFGLLRLPETAPARRR